MSRFIAISLLAGAAIFAGVTSTPVQAGQWVQSQGYWYWYDDDGTCYYADGDNYYRWDEGNWVFYAPWSRGFSGDSGLRFDFRFRDRDRGWDGDRNRDLNRDRGRDDGRRAPSGGGGRPSGGRR